MSNKIIFGADLIDVLENKYNMYKLGEVPTKYKNGVITIDFIYGKEKDIDDLKYDKPYVEFSIDDETDGFISGTMYLNGGVEGIQFDSWEDLKYFMKNAKWTESMKYVRKSLKEGIDVKIVYWDDTPTDYLDDITRNDIVDLENDTNVYKIIDVTNGKKKTIYLAESKKSVKKSMKEEMDTSVVGTNKDKTKKYAYDFLKEWYENIVVESLMNDDGDYVLKIGFYDDLLKKDPSIMDKVSAKLSGNSRFLQMLDDDTACKLVVYDVNNPRKYEVYWL